jgi:cytochrome c553
MARVRTIWAFVSVVVLIGASACDTTPTPGIDRGEAVFDTCVPCHGSDGAGNQVLAAPAIAGLPQWYITAQLQKYQSAMRGANPFDTVGLRMKSMSLAIDLEGDLESVAEYVASMPSVTAASTLARGDAEAGQLAYGLCAACHGATGDGMEVLGAPPLKGQHDWYLVSQLQKYRSGWRGTAPGDIQGATMRPNALTMDDQAMEDVVAYIQTLN